MRHGADKLPRGIARQLGIGVQGDDVLHVGSAVLSPTISEKASCAATAQQRVQIGQLAALALVTHPDALLLRIPAPRAMEEEKDVVLRGQSGLTIAGAIFLVEFAASISRAGEFGSNSGASCSGSDSWPHRQNRSAGKMQTGIAIGQKPTSSASTRSSMPAALVSMVGTTTSVCDVGGMPVEKSMRGSGLRRHQQGGQPVDQRHRQLAARQHGQQASIGNHAHCGMANRRQRQKTPVRMAVISPMAPR
jgi:hypothetical protein